jgi:hypothetical protein
MIKGLFDVMNGDEILEYTPVPGTPWVLNVFASKVVDLTMEIVPHATRVVEDQAGRPHTADVLHEIGHRLVALHQGVSWTDYLLVLEVMET